MLIWDPADLVFQVATAAISIGELIHSPSLLTPLGFSFLICKMRELHT